MQHASPSVTHLEAKNKSEVKNGFNWTSDSKHTPKLVYPNLVCCNG